MSLDFRTIPTTPWKGSTPQSVEIALCKPTQFPRALVVDIDFADYPVTSGTQGVYVDLAAQGAAQPLDKIASLKIDNTGNPQIIYVQFPDVSDIVTVPPKSVLTVAALTNHLIFVVYNRNIDPNVAKPKLRIHAINVILDPLLEQEQSGSLALGIGKQNVPIPLAIGDNMTDFVYDMTTTAAIQVPGFPIGSANPARTLVLTRFCVTMFGCYNATTVIGNLTLHEFFNGIDVRVWDYAVGPDLTLFPPKILDQTDGAQIKVDQGLGKFFTMKNSVALTAGFVRFNIGFADVAGV